jgi:hypothetical protein
MRYSELMECGSTATGQADVPLELLCHVNCQLIYGLGKGGVFLARQGATSVGVGQ